MADPGFALYVHWPFCLAKCPYCDFNSHVSSGVDQARWRSALLAELSHFAELTPNRVLTSIYFGGGTPSLMDGRTVDGIITAARRHWPAANDLEVTLEANPTSVEARRFEEFHAAGVNRVSIGVQALVDQDLKALGRLHSVNDALVAVEVAQSVFARSSFDLIYARETQTLFQWEEELLRAVSLADGHLSLYQLTVEPGTAFHDRQRRGGLVGLPSEDVQADMFELTQDICVAAGLPAYEISNHASAGQESRHNLTYWRAGDWIGIGPGAHGRLTLGDRRVGTETLSDPTEWLTRVESSGWGRKAFDYIEPRDRDVEYLMMALRTTEGVELKRLKSLAIGDAADRLDDMGLISVSSGRIATTVRGRPLLNAVLRDLLAD